MEVHGCAISISTGKDSYASGDRINMKIRFKNNGSKSITIERGGFAHYSVTVLFDNKGSAPLTLYGQRILGRGQIGGSLATLDLKPSQETSIELPLSRLFDFSLAGNYEISVVRKVKDPDTNTWFDVTSNKIEISVDDSFVTHVVN
jgi:hypothetical protein